jgi:hypothetical protein
MLKPTMRGDQSDPQAEAFVSEWRRLRALTADEIIKRAPFRVYGLDRVFVRASYIHGFSARDLVPDKVQLVHRARVGRCTSAVIVESAADETACLVPDAAAARHAVERFADELDSSGADAHRIPASESRAPRSAESQRQQIKLSVDGHEAEFVLLRSNGSWAATAVVQDQRLTVVGNAFDPARVSLVGVDARTGDVRRRRPGH